MVIKQDIKNIVFHQHTYTIIDLYMMALSKIRAPNGPVNSGLMTCFVSSVRSYRMGLSPPPIESKYRAQLVSVSFPTKGNA